MLVDPSQKFCIIANPVAGHGKAQAILPKVTALLTDYGVQFDLAVTTGPRHAEALAMEFANSGYRAIVAMGGDGTLGEVVNGVMTAGQPSMPLAAIPAGTGNDFISGNCLFSHWSQAVQALVCPEIRQMDVMLVKDSGDITRYAINSLGVGFDAYVVKRVAERKSKRFGSISYAFEVIRGLFRFHPEDMRVAIDGTYRNVEKVWLCAAMNSENLGGGIAVTPGAVSDDGYLHIGYLFDTPRLRLISLLFSAVKGQHVDKPGVYITKGAKGLIDAPEDFPCHMDGDLMDVTYPISVELVPAAIPFLVGKSAVE